MINMMRFKFVKSAPQIFGSLFLILYTLQRSSLKLPVAVPIPINEEPAFAIVARTSAKSTFTSPGICNKVIHHHRVQIITLKKQ